MRSIRLTARRTTTVLATAGLAACGTLVAVTAQAAPTAESPSTLSAAAITSTLAKDASIPGTAWMADPSGRIIVNYDKTVTGAKWNQLSKATQKFGDRIILEPVNGVFKKYLQGGDAIYGGGYRCSVGFNVRSGSTYYFLTAGHCGNITPNWYANSARTTLVGTVTGSSFPGNDYAIARYPSTYTNHPGSVNLYNGSSQDITTARNAVLNENVRRSGSTTGVRNGRVTGLNATVNYAEGTVSGLIRTNVCAEGGDSGGALFNGTAALGLTSGGSGNCSSGGTTFFQPVTEVLSRYGVSVY